MSAPQKTPQAERDQSREAIENLPPLEASRDAESSGADLATALYDAFWRRNNSPDVTPFAEQASAIRLMWFGIANDAIAALSRTTGGAA